MGEGPRTPLILPVARLHTGVNQTPGLIGDLGLTVVLSLGGLGDGSQDLIKHSVCFVQGIQGPDRGACTLT